MSLVSPLKHDLTVEWGVTLVPWPALNGSWGVPQCQCGELPRPESDKSCQEFSPADTTAWYKKQPPPPAPHTRWKSSRAPPETVWLASSEQYLPSWEFMLLHQKPPCIFRLHLGSWLHKGNVLHVWGSRQQQENQSLKLGCFVPSCLPLLCRISPGNLQEQELASAGMLYDTAVSWPVGCYRSMSCTESGQFLRWHQANDPGC